jgi:fused signal recognition particle receptor
MRAPPSVAVRQRPTPARVTQVSPAAHSALDAQSWIVPCPEQLAAQVVVAPAPPAPAPPPPKDAQHTSPAAQPLAPWQVTPGRVPELEPLLEPELEPLPEPPLLDVTPELEPDPDPDPDDPEPGKNELPASVPLLDESVVPPHAAATAARAEMPKRILTVRMNTSSPATQ